MGELPGPQNDPSNNQHSFISFEVEEGELIHPPRIPLSFYLKNPIDHEAQTQYEVKEKPPTAIFKSIFKLPKRSIKWSRRRSHGDERAEDSIREHFFNKPGRISDVEAYRKQGFVAEKIEIFNRLSRETLLPFRSSNHKKNSLQRLMLMPSTALQLSQPLDHSSERLNTNSTQFISLVHSTSTSSGPKISIDISRTDYEDMSRTDYEDMSKDYGDISLLKRTAKERKYKILKRPTILKFSSLKLLRKKALKKIMNGKNSEKTSNSSNTSSIVTSFASGGSSGISGRSSSFSSSSTRDGEIGMVRLYKPLQIPRVFSMLPMGFNPSKIMGMVKRMMRGMETLKCHEEKGLWKKKVMMGRRCQLPTFSGLVLYDDSGNQLRRCESRADSVHEL